MKKHAFYIVLFAATAALASLQITAPLSGETWPTHSVRNITWSSDGVSKVQLEYSLNNGTTWTSLADSMVSTGFYAWTVPDTVSSHAKIRIHNIKPGSNDTDTVDFLTDVPFLRLTSPNGGEEWFQKSTRLITWTALSAPYVKIEYSVDSGAHWSTVIASTLSTGSYNWSVPNTLSSLRSLIRISDLGSPNLVDQSDSTFKISTPPPTLTLISPNGGENWNTNTPYSITWTRGAQSASLFSGFRLEYSINNGADWTTITDFIPVSTANSQQQFSWTFFPPLQSIQAKVRVSDNANPAVSDISDKVFSIGLPTSISPRGIRSSGVDPMILLHHSVMDVRLESGIKVLSIQAKDVRGRELFNWNAKNLEKGNYSIAIPDFSGPAILEWRADARSRAMVIAPR